MKVTHRTAGLGIAVVAMLMLGTAAIADNMGQMGMGDDMGGHGRMSGMMMAGPVLDLPAIDTDKDGKISKDEMTAFRAARVAAVDANSDGKLSAEELAAMHLQTMTDAAKTMADRMIERLDADGDTLLSAVEMADRPLPSDMFDRIDFNADGFIDQAEIDAAKERMTERGARMGGKWWHFGGDHDGMGDGGN